MREGHCTVSEAGTAGNAQWLSLQTGKGEAGPYSQKNMLKSANCNLQKTDWDEGAWASVQLLDNVEGTCPDSKVGTA